VPDTFWTKLCDRISFTKHGYQQTYRLRNTVGSGGLRNFPWNQYTRFCRL